MPAAAAGHTLVLNFYDIGDAYHHVLMRIRIAARIEFAWQPAHDPEPVWASTRCRLVCPAMT